MIMKTIILPAICICFFIFSADAQTKKTTAKTKTTNAGMQSAKKSSSTNAATYLSASDNYSAKSNINSISAGNTYTIADPTLRALNARANGSDISISKSGIVGMPKRAYGFANGHLTLYSTGATSSGTITGNGAVGTGSSLGSIGSSGPAIGLNGKSPYAGSTMWGNARGLQVTRGDSAVRVGRGKE
jgi:hypothetical protein